MIYLLYILYAYLNGSTEAFIYARKGADSLPADEHNWFTAERILLGGAVVIGVLYGTFFGTAAALYLVCLESVASAAGFSYWHNGWYYLMRDKIDGTAHGWKYQSPTDTAKTQLNYQARLKWLYVSFGILAAGIVVLTYWV